MYLQSPILHLSTLATWLIPQASSISVMAQNLSPILTPSSTSISDFPDSGPTTNTRYLFGGPQPWNTSSLFWKAVDDRVRGGSSTSFLDPLQTSRYEGKDCLGSAKFYGVLDTKTLGGAGFASRSTKAVAANGSEQAQEPVWDLGRYEGLLLGVEGANGKTYTFTLKDQLPESQRDDGREQAGISWEADFQISDSNRVKKEEDGVSQFLVRIPWNAFRATYRGRDKPDAEPLDPSKIRRFALMARSFFEKQDGEFELIIDYIAAYQGDKV